MPTDDRLKEALEQWRRTDARLTHARHFDDVIDCLDEMRGLLAEVKGSPVFDNQGLRSLLKEEMARSLEILEEFRPGHDF